MTVINQNSISGITSITLPSGDGNVLTIHTNDGTERFRIDSSGNVKVGSACTISQDGDVFFTGVTTATTYAGSGANLTNLPAANLTGALPAISGANLTGIAATDNVRTGILDVAGVSTFRNTMNVGAAVTISESGIEASGIGITVANINGTQISGRRNIAINGDMRIAQRGTVTGITNGASAYGGPDRFKTTVVSHGTYTSSQETDAPTGFTHSLKVNTTSADSSLASSARLYVQHKIEKQDLLQLKKGTSSAKQLTVQFFVKSDKTGTYVLELWDNVSNRHVSATYTISSADTWEQKILTYPADTGGSAYDSSNANTAGIEFNWWLAAGSNFTSGSLASTWSNNDDTKRVVGITVNVGDSGYWQLAGVQIETGTQATAYEYRSFQEELARCQRYFQRFESGGDHHHLAAAGEGSSSCKVGIPLAVPLRAAPTVACGNHRWYRSSTGGYTQSTDAPTNTNFNTTANSPVISLLAGGHTSSNNEPGVWTPYNDNDLTFDSEM